MRPWISASLFPLLVAASPSLGQGADLRGVVELFTSQGCSSCPPADKVVDDLIGQNGLVVLTYHVDYWNYLGWNDTLASKEATIRQYDYARAMKRNGVYTPQVIINGRDHVKGAEKGAIEAKLADFSNRNLGLVVPVNVERRANDVLITIGKAPDNLPASQRSASIVSQYFVDFARVKVERGENAGQEITYRHAVIDQETVGRWTGEKMELVLPATVFSGDKNGMAILLQQADEKGRPSAILGAAALLRDEID